MKYYFKLILFAMLVSGCDSEIESELILYHEPKITCIIPISEYDQIFEDNLIDHSEFNISYKKKGRKYDYLFRLGFTIDDLTEKKPIFIREEEVYNTYLENDIKNDQNVIYVPFSEDLDPDYYMEQNVRFDTIGNFLCKIIIPRHGRKGIYAYHFYSIFNDPINGDLKLSIIGNDLSREQEDDLKKIANSIRVE